MITRRGLLAGILCAGVSPWIVKAGVLMPVKRIVVPEWGDGFASLLQQPQIEIDLQVRQYLQIRIDAACGQILADFQRCKDATILNDGFGNYGCTPPPQIIAALTSMKTG